MIMKNHALLTTLVLAAGVVSAETPSETLRKLCDDYSEFNYRADPSRATAVGRNEYNDRWTDLSSAAIQARANADRRVFQTAPRDSRRRADRRRRYHGAHSRP